MKKATAVIAVLIILASLASCTGNSKNQPYSAESSNYTKQDSTETLTITESSSLPASNLIPDGTSEAAALGETEKAPSQWTDEEIIEFYKSAAKKSHSTAKSSQVMVLNKLIINNGEGALGFFTKILEPAIRSVIEKNALEFDGITGGFKNLTANDTKTTKAYKSGEYTVIEMTMKNQTDGIHGNEHEGSVGHAISVLGDISRVLAEFPQFNVDIDNARIAVNYVNATVKVKINKNGIIEKGTWKYTCDPDISNLSISGIMVHAADAEIDYIITVGGGA